MHACCVTLLSLAKYTPQQLFQGYCLMSCTLLRLCQYFNIISCMHLTTFSEFCLDYVVSLCYKHVLQQLLCAFKAFLAFSGRAIQSEVKCGLSRNQAHLFNDIALRDCQNCQIGRPYRDAQDRQLWRDCTYLMSWKAYYSDYLSGLSVVTSLPVADCRLFCH